MYNIAIIGAGIAGLTLANSLKNKYNITIFEKSRGYGGRIATRRYKQHQFDHGAQFFKAKTNEFKQFIKPLIENNVIQRWDARFVEFTKGTVSRQTQWDDELPHYVGYPSMNNIGHALAQDLTIHLNTKVLTVNKKKYWELFGENNISLGAFDWVVSTLPAKQSNDLLHKFMQQTIKEDHITPCYSLMLGLTKQQDLGFDAALVKELDLSWISVDSSKPGRNGKTCLLVHSTNKWATENIELDLELVREHLIKELTKIITIPEYELLKVHRWLYANCKKNSGEKYYLNPDFKLAICGDSFLSGRVESAFLSAHHLAEAFAVHQFNK
jgi:predicted NAD/FAD-dependent oxidoreductase